MPVQVKAVLWVDDEAELLEPHRIFLRDKGFEVETATNADDALEMVRRRPFDLVLLDEQMPGTRGLEAVKEIREIEPGLQIVMVTKSEEDGTLTEALGKNIAGYLVKPVTPRQVHAMVSGLLEGPRIRQQVVARTFVDRFRAMQGESLRDLDWRGWIDRYLEMVQWDLDLTAANEMGLHESLRGLFPELRRDFAQYVARAYPDWLAHLEGDRPPLSIDIVSEFLMPVVQQDNAAAFIVIDCLRLDQWKFLEPVISHSSRSRRRTTSACCQRRPHTPAMPCSAVSFPTRSLRVFPTGGASVRTKHSTRTRRTCSRRISSRWARRCQ